MQAIEFSTISENGKIAIPNLYSTWFAKPVRVILLAEDSTPITPAQSFGQFIEQFRATADFEVTHGDTQPVENLF